MICASVSGDRHASGAVIVMRIALWDKKFFLVIVLTCRVSTHNLMLEAGPT